ncbi:MAG: ribonuclease HII [candidate division Zixibacteria bacterium RBG_16_53_22]|nr:MAG: ribonuclease HII [candidate division Zixibacteria bacterium RBG_16_53_22]
MPGRAQADTLSPRGFIGQLICGVDEAGRGPLAGPVVAAAVILCDGFDTKGIRDSKSLTPARRQEQRERLLDSSCLWGIGVVGHEIIDKINILQASFLAMRRAIEALGVEPEIVLVDGRHPLPGLTFKQQALVGGDKSEPCISAASIMAKTYRDQLMLEYSGLYPAYGFGKHKGYGTPEHLANLFEHGPCLIHRRTFHPVSTYYPRPKPTNDKPTA